MFTLLLLALPLLASAHYSVARPYYNSNRFHRYHSNNEDWEQQLPEPSYEYESPYDYEAPTNYYDSCSWQGHCLGATCRIRDDCSDDLTCTQGKCAEENWQQWGDYQEQDQPEKMEEQNQPEGGEESEKEEQDSPEEMEDQKEEREEEGDHPEDEGNQDQPKDQEEKDKEGQDDGEQDGDQEEEEQNEEKTGGDRVQQQPAPSNVPTPPVTNITSQTRCSEPHFSKV
jgi:hypothetical protein